MRPLTYVTFSARIINQVSSRSLYYVHKVSISEQKLLTKKRFRFLNESNFFKIADK